MNKNKKISRGLKRHYENKRKQTAVKKGLAIAIPFILAICLISEMSEKTNAHISDFKTSEIVSRVFIPKEEKNSVAVVNIENKEELSVKDEIVKIAEEENFQYTGYLLRLLYCESRFDTGARNDNGKWGKDRGVAQINSYFHPNVTDKQADNLEFAVKFTMEKINAGYQELWVCNQIVKGKTKEQLAYNY